MAPSKTPAQSADNPKVLPEHVAERYVAALATVRELLSSAGLDTRWVSRIRLRLYGNGRRGGEGVPRPMAPELLVYGMDGAKIAEMTVEARSGAFLVSLSGQVAPAHLVPSDKPELVVKLMPVEVAS